ncbi:hypothetical protein H6G20_03090 [Desertifilum sp. FACHB-1129]|uniref:Uncharacterized protein n=1 Tax=Desertifilum tharense IPPAS B-1220 TaxID=1781255 RepID=A0ACD5GX10_9CYAN|nr:MULTISPECIES: hypothetical protein [Desertifilum]MBD2310663.1 hypothetical protein [Desertifilum sp. FACHB-1129]MBD2320700.1 hypothetical protein [Desertifilum sp. FACHB-866]MDA0209847.1 hypothetical protein [Cyanobacteria bacterium FC1]
MKKPLSDRLNFLSAVKLTLLFDKRESLNPCTRFTGGDRGTRWMNLETRRLTQNGFFWRQQRKFRYLNQGRLSASCHQDKHGSAIANPTIG